MRLLGWTNEGKYIRYSNKIVCKKEKVLPSEMTSFINGHYLRYYLGYEFELSILAFLFRHAALFGVRRDHGTTELPHMCVASTISNPLGQTLESRDILVD